MDTLVPLPGDSFIGYVIHCSDDKPFANVLKLVEGAAVARVNEMTIIELGDFIFLQPERVMNRHASDCWRRRYGIHKVNHVCCMHKDGATAVEGLPATMQPSSTRSNCQHYVPSEVGGRLATADLPQHAGGGGGLRPIYHSPGEHSTRFPADHACRPCAVR